MTALENFISRCKGEVCLVIQRDGEGDCLLRVLHRGYSEYAVWCGGIEIWRTHDRDQAQMVYDTRRSEYEIRLDRLSYAG